MASTALCVYCFEVLSARLENRSALNLQHVEELWAKYNGEDIAASGNDEVKLSETSEQSSIEDEEDEEVLSKHNLRPRQISRLQNTSTGQSSSASTPSNSSSQTLSSETSITSSESSLSSIATTSGKRKEEKYPLFVTWQTLNSRGHRSLRGCIGTFDAQPLSSGLKEYALTSAFNDVRFSPISLSELPTLACDITLLLNFRPCKDPLDWDIGTHGIRISFMYHNRRYGSTYLPQVAPEQGWTKEETMISLMRKAGWSGRSSEWRKVTDLKCTKYEGELADIDYATFRAWRDWVSYTNGEN